MFGAGVVVPSRNNHVTSWGPVPILASHLDGQRAGGREGKNAMRRQESSSGEERRAPPKHRNTETPKEYCSRPSIAHSISPFIIEHRTSEPCLLCQARPRAAVRLPPHRRCRLPRCQIMPALLLLQAFHTRLRLPHPLRQPNRPRCPRNTSRAFTTSWRIC